MSRRYRGNIKRSAYCVVACYVKRAHNMHHASCITYHVSCAHCSEESSMSWVDKVLGHLSAGGHRVTEPRRAILERIAQYHQPFSAEQLFRDVSRDNGSIGRATVYRTVELLYDDHWLARVHWSAAQESALAGEHAYVPIEQGHQHHMICKKCG